MSQIAYIAPNEGLADIARAVFSQHKLDVAVEVGTTHEGVKKAEELVKQGIKVIISRGGTTFSIRKRLNIPVVDTKIAIQDIAKAIEQASKLGSRIAIIGFYNLLEGFEAFNPLLNIDLRQIYVESEEDALEKITGAKKDGVDVIIGGVLQYEIAKRLELKSVFLESGHKAIYDAYQEAEVILRTLLNEKRKAEEIRSVLDLARDGFLAIDKYSRISLINPTAAKLLNCDVNTSIGKLLEDISPDLANLSDVLQSGKEYFHDITSLGSTTIVYTRRPIIVDNQIVGAVATLQDINIVQETETKIRRKIYTHGLYARYSFNDIDGTSKEISKSIEFARKFAKTDSTVLITGESGTGKELFAQSIHNASSRHKGPFVAINCASLPENILESELFGYVEGAFTGARKQGKVGLFELAHQGTIFLDEISEMPISLQGRLLRVLEERIVMRLGDDKVIPINVRVIAASNRNLVELVNKGDFREDLFFRINILRLPLAPLRDRKEDIPHIANRLLKGHILLGKSLDFSDNALNRLISYSWPGNVRELKNLVERAAILADSSVIKIEIIEEFMKENKLLCDRKAEDIPITEERIEQVLESVGYNKTKAAEILGIHRSTLWRILNKSEK